MRYKIKFIAICFLFAAVLIAAFSLYKLPLQAVWYPLLLCFVLGVLFLFLDFVYINGKHKRLERLLELDPLLMEISERPESIYEEDYQKIVNLLKEVQKKQADEASASYSDMVDYYTLWAHQIKTPIASMRINLQNEDSEFSRKLQMDLNRVEQYVDMVLTYLRLDSNSTDYVLGECDLDEIIKPVLRKFMGDFIGKGLTLNYNPCGVKVLTDEKWLSFVIEQVLSNAVKYTNKGTISIICEDKSLHIQDTGMGIAPSDLPRIFDNGYTGFNGRTDKKASGIGLYLCKRICKNLGHEIEVTSKPGEGTDVAINLSRDRVDIE